MTVDQAIHPVSAAALAAFALAATAASLAASGWMPGAAAGVIAALALVGELRRMPRRPADAAAWCCFALALVLAALPSRGTASLAFLATGLACLRAGPAGRGAAALFAALAGAGLAESLAGHLVAVPVLALEAQAVRLMLHVVFGIDGEAVGNTVTLTQAGRILVILRGCSLLALLPPLLLAGLALARLIAPDRPLPIIRLCLAAAIAALLNLVRLGAMAVSEDAAAFFHAAIGEALLQVTWLGLALAAALPPGRQRG